MSKMSTKHMVIGYDPKIQKQISHFLNPLARRAGGLKKCNLTPRIVIQYGWGEGVIRGWGLKVVKMQKCKNSATTVRPHSSMNVAANWKRREGMVQKPEENQTQNLGMQCGA